MKNRFLKIISGVVLIVSSSSVFAANVTVPNLKIERLGVDAVGPNRFVHVSPTQLQCTAVGSSKMLFNSPIDNPNTSMIYSTLLAAMMGDKEVEIVHDGTAYCKIVRVTILK